MVVGSIAKYANRKTGIQMEQKWIFNELSLQESFTFVTSNWGQTENHNEKKKKKIILNFMDRSQNNAQFMLPP